MKAPFPYFGGKSKVSDVIWERLGNVPNYVEPFFGSGAVLLSRETVPNTETVNDKDSLLANFWRAVKAAPDAVAAAADWPVSEVDLSARHVHLVESKPALSARIEVDADFYDAKLAGWWVWGACGWIGSGWCSGEGPWTRVDGAFVKLGDAGQGINRQLPHLGDAGRGINRKLPHLSDAGRGIRDVMRALCERLRGVRIACGDWTRVVGDSVTIKHGVTGVLLDPPYGEGAVDYSSGGNGCGGIANDVAKWAIANGENPLYRIAYCGYYGGKISFPETWEAFSWQASGGFGLQGDGDGRANSARETIWFSPHCIKATQRDLFDERNTKPENRPQTRMDAGSQAESCKEGK